VREYLGAKILAALALVVLLAGPTPSFAANGHLDKLAARIGKAMSAELGYPSDLSFYQEMVSYGHNFDTARDSPSKDFIPALSGKQPMIRQVMPDAKLTITRAVASGDTIVLISELMGTLPDATAYHSKTATFFKIENGRIRGMDVWMDLAEGMKLLKYLRKDGGAAAPKTGN
jgi:hypothetical protein